jgi:porin
MGYSPTILALPTYPEPKPAVTVFFAPVLHYQVSAGLFRTARSGNMLLFEGARDWRIGDRELAGRSSFGMWRLGGPVACFDGDAMDSTRGFYAVAEQGLWKDMASGQKELDAFLQFGLANGDVSRFTRHIGGGIVLQGPFSSRPHDSLGLASTSARFTDAHDAGYQYDAELAVETYYKLGLGKYVSLVPDVQFIHHPGGLLLQKDALVLTPRLALSF